MLRASLAAEEAGTQAQTLVRVTRLSAACIPTNMEPAVPTTLLHASVMSSKAYAESESAVRPPRCTPAWPPRRRAPKCTGPGSLAYAVHVPVGRTAALAAPGSDNPTACMCSSKPQQLCPNAPSSLCAGAGRGCSRRWQQRRRRRRLDGQLAAAARLAGAAGASCLRAATTHAFSGTLSNSLGWNVLAHAQGVVTVRFASQSLRWSILTQSLLHFHHQL